MADFAARARTFARAVREMPNNVAALRRDVENRPRFPVNAPAAVLPRQDSGEERRLDELAAAIATPGEITPGVAMATVTDTDAHRSAVLADQTARTLGQPVSPIVLAPGTESAVDTLADGTIVRTPERLDWIRAAYVLIHVSAAEYTVLLHPGATPEYDTLAEMVHALDESTMATGLVITRCGSNRELAEPSTISVVRTQAARRALAGTYRHIAMSTPLDILIRRSNRSVHVLPRLAGVLDNQDGS